MEDKHKSARILRIRLLHEILFSSTIAFAGISLLFLVVPSLSIPFVRLEHRLNRILEIQETDLVKGNFEFAIPSAALALCLLIMFRLFSRSRFSEEILRSVAGIMTLSAAPTIWFYLLLRYDRPFLTLRSAATFVELGVALVCGWLFLQGRWPIPGWCSVLFLASHYAYWFWICGSFSLSNFLGPIGAVLAFSSSVVWGLYAASAHSNE